MTNYIDTLQRNYLGYVELADGHKEYTGLFDTPEAAKDVLERLIVAYAVFSIKVVSSAVVLHSVKPEAL